VGKAVEHGLKGVELGILLSIGQLYETLCKHDHNESNPPPRRGSGMPEQKKSDEDADH